MTTIHVLPIQPVRRDAGLEQFLGHALKSRWYCVTQYQRYRPEALPLARYDPNVVPTEGEVLDQIGDWFRARFGRRNHTWALVYCHNSLQALDQYRAWLRRPDALVTA